MTSHGTAASAVMPAANAASPPKGSVKLLVATRGHVLNDLHHRAALIGSSGISNWDEGQRASPR